MVLYNEYNTVIYRVHEKIANIQYTHEFLLATFYYFITNMWSTNGYLQVNI